MTYGKLLIEGWAMIDPDEYVTSEPEEMTYYDPDPFEDICE